MIDIIAAALVLVFLLLPAAVFFVEVLIAARGHVPRLESLQSTTDSDPRLAILMPAHNEASGIGQCVSSLIKKGYKVTVVADNCTDNTAERARLAGATVVVRNDLTKRGKGYALDFGIQSLLADPPDVVIVFDADCELVTGSLFDLARACLRDNRPLQCHYRMVYPHAKRGQQAMAEFAWVIKNYVRPLGLMRLSLPCQLMGSGMAFPWHVIKNITLASGEAVEDLQLGIDCAELGYAPKFAPSIVVRSFFPENKEGQASQRERWEAGHLQMIRKRGLPAVVEGVRTSNRDLLCMGLDLLVPPLAFLGLIIAMATSTTLGGILIGLSWFPAFLSLLSLVMFVCAVAIAWYGFGRDLMTIKAFLLSPLYLARKLPTYARALAGKPAQWIRTKRDSEL